MRVLITIVFSLCIMHCGPQPEFYTSQNIGVYTNEIDGITYELMDRWTQCYVDNINIDGDIAESIDTVVIVWEPEPFLSYVDDDGKSEPVLCNGIRYYYRIHAVWYGDTTQLSMAIYYHELTHWVLSDFGMRDPTHAKTDIWEYMENDLVNYCL